MYPLGGPGQSGEVSPPGAAGKFGQRDDHRDLAGIENREMRVGRVPRIVPTKATAGSYDSSWKGDTILEHVVSHIVKKVHAPVAHLTRTCVPIPMPIVVPLVAVDGLINGGPQPEVVIKGRRGVAVPPVCRSRPARHTDSRGPIERRR